jgi:hypothetical protein
MAFCIFGQGAVNTICLQILLKHFEVVDMVVAFQQVAPCSI